MKIPLLEIVPDASHMPRLSYQHQKANSQQLQRSGDRSRHTYITLRLGTRYDTTSPPIAALPSFRPRIRSLAVGDAKTCPHGHPIDSKDRIQGVPLADVEIGAKVHVLRFENEAEDLLHYLRGAGLEPGVRGTLASADDDEVTMDLDDGGVATVTRSVSETVAVQADPSPPPRTLLPAALVLGQERYGR